MSGCCVESKLNYWKYKAMATSDNVVRAGLTPKLKDIDTLLSMLTYIVAYRIYLKNKISYCRWLYDGLSANHVA